MFVNLKVHAGNRILDTIQIEDDVQSIVYKDKLYKVNKKSCDIPYLWYYYKTDVLFDKIKNKK